MVQRKRTHGLRGNTERVPSKASPSRGTCDQRIASDARQKQVKSDRRHKLDGFEEEVDETYTIPVQDGTQWVRGDDCTFRSVCAPNLADFVTHKFDQKEWVDVPMAKAAKDCKKEPEAHGNWIIL
eukprot:GEMP01079228.1.p1 GENE.GEMP01079228.1~~GEMP01079228.1.p1  ORF type:complete len:125 (+),score=28.58 GEMP01079228.1:242-616(+)